MPRARKSEPAALGILCTVLSPARAQDVLDHREMIGAPMTKRAAELLILKLAEAPDPNAAADMMISKGWRGFDVGWGQPLQKMQRFDPKPTFNDLAEFYDAQSEREGRGGAGAGPLFSNLPKLSQH